MGLVYAASALSLFWYAPQWLSYYNLLIGGLPGATAAGMEPTYYWDGLDRCVLDWLHAHTGPGEKVEFAAGPWENLELMRAWGVLRCEYQPQSPGEFRWYVLQRRPSAWQPADRWLIEHARPAFAKTIRPGGFGPWRLDVPLVEVYSYDRYLEAVDATVSNITIEEHGSGISRSVCSESPAEHQESGHPSPVELPPLKSVIKRRARADAFGAGNDLGVEPYRLVDLRKSLCCRKILWENVLRRHPQFRPEARFAASNQWASSYGAGLTDLERGALPAHGVFRAAVPAVVGLPRFVQGASLRRGLQLVSCSN